MSPEEEKKHIGRGFGAIGLFIGLVAGFSTAELTTTLLALVFALAGGSVAAVMNKLDAQARAAAGQALFAFGLSASLALVGALLLRINGLLVFTDTPTAAIAAQTPLRQGAMSIEGECLRRMASGSIDVAPFCPAPSASRSVPGN